MANNGISTRDQLLETAGQLFAEHGFKGTSIKMIAEATGQNIAAVNYHFGSKHNLLINTLKFVLEKIMTPVSAAKPADPNCLIDELQRYIFERCNFLLGSKSKIWYGRLIVRAGFEMPFSEGQSGIEFYKPDFDYLESIAKRFNPDISGNQARLWAYSVVGQIFFYVFGRDMILLANNLGNFDAQMVREIAKHITRVSAGWLLQASNKNQPKSTKQNRQNKTREQKK